MMKTLNQKELAMVSGGDNPGQGPYDPPKEKTPLEKFLDSFSEWGPNNWFGLLK